MEFKLNRDIIDLLHKIILEGNSKLAYIGNFSNIGPIEDSYHGCNGGCDGSCDGSCDGCGACDDRCDGCCEDSMWG